MIPLPMSNKGKRKIPKGVSHEVIELCEIQHCTQQCQIFHSHLTVSMIVRITLPNAQFAS
jgi:hypothetical protein